MAYPSDKCLEEMTLIKVEIKKKLREKRENLWEFLPVLLYSRTKNEYILKIAVSKR